MSDKPTAHCPRPASEARFVAISETYVNVRHVVVARVTRIAHRTTSGDVRGWAVAAELTNGQVICAGRFGQHERAAADACLHQLAGRLNAHPNTVCGARQTHDVADPADEPPSRAGDADDGDEDMNTLEAMYRKLWRAIVAAVARGDCAEARRLTDQRAALAAKLEAWCS